MGTQLHMTNALCVLCGLLFGPGAGFLAAGLGSGLYDIVAGWGAECIITFINKGVIGLVAGLIAEVSGKKVPFEIAGRRDGDPPVLVASNEKARKLLGWNPQFSDIKRILTDALNWEKNRRY